MQSERFDLAAAWDNCAAMIGWLVALFGAPEAIAQKLSLRRGDRQQLIAWLAPLEALARRLLFLEAASLPPSNAPAPFVAKGKLRTAFRDTQPVELDADPARWRVVFRIGAGSPPAPPLAGQEAAGWKPAAPGLDPMYNAAPLARRLEALRRLSEDRARIVARLARRLQARPRALARAFAPYRHPAAFCAEAMREAQACADHALQRYADTS